MPIPGSEFRPFHQVERDSAGADYEIAFPTDQPLVFHVASGDLLLSNAQGLTITDSSPGETFQQKAGDPNPKTFTYTVTGVRQ
jgi:hypothetical protein